MKILVIGSGGREHAICWKLSQSKQVKEIHCAPGNGGTSLIAKNIAVSVDDLLGLLHLAKQENYDLTIVGPELPLTLGIVNLFEENNLKIFGPNRAASQLEDSKAFSKEIMAEGGVPTAKYDVFYNFEDCIRHIQIAKFPLVIKFDGLAQGKGVAVCQNLTEATEFLDTIYKKKIFGISNQRVIIEDCLEGEEASVLALVDRDSFVLLPSAQDHKRVGNNDTGPNTGGMGAYSPAPVVTDEIMEQIKKNVFEKVLKTLKKHDIIFKGVLYAGIMLTSQGPKVLEFNVRFGDPETQAILMRLDNDLLELCLAVVDNRLSQISLQINSQPSLCVVLCSEGYPGVYPKNKLIKGWDQNTDKQVQIFHSGTAVDQQKFYTSGGRVLSVTALGNNLQQAQKHTYSAIQSIRFEGMHYRSDIGYRALQSSNATT